MGGVDEAALALPPPHGYRDNSARPARVCPSGGKMLDQSHLVGCIALETLASGSRFSRQTLGRYPSFYAYIALSLSPSFVSFYTRGRNSINPSLGQREYLRVFSSGMAGGGLRV